MRVMLALLSVFLAALPAGSQSFDYSGYSQGQRALGPVVLRELSIRDGKLSFRVDSGGCTDAASFRVNVVRAAGISASAPHYRLTIVRTRADDCKALLWEGVLIEMDLQKDVGLTGNYTLSVENPVTPQSGAPRAESAPDDPRAALLRATVRAIDMEVEAYQGRLQTALGGTGPAENVARFRQKLADLQAMRDRFARMKPDEYPAPAEIEETGSILDATTEYGPILPPTLREVAVAVDGSFRDGSLLSSVDGTSRSGPFFHLAGIVGDDYGILKEGRRYTLTLCLVYRREYFGTVGDYYVYVTAVRPG